MSGRTWQWFESWIFLFTLQSSAVRGGVRVRKVGFLLFSVFGSLLVKVTQEGAERGDTYERCKDFGIEKKAEADGEREDREDKKKTSLPRLSSAVVAPQLAVCLFFIFNMSSLF